MRLPTTNRLPCSVCGRDTLQHYGWFVVVENRWLDRLKIFTWHPSLAMLRDSKSACCQEHLKLMIGHWLTQASLRLPPTDDGPTPIAGVPDRVDAETDPVLLGFLVGELSVYREAFSREWTGSPATFECILDALVPDRKEHRQTREFQPLSSLHEPYHGLALH